MNKSYSLRPHCVSCWTTYILQDDTRTLQCQVSLLRLSHHVDMDVNSDCADTFIGIMNNQAYGKAGIHTSSLQSLLLVLRPIFSHLRNGV